MERQRYFQGFYWSRAVAQRFSLPLLLGIIATIAVLVLWQQVLAEEHLHTERLVQQQVTTIQTELEKDLTAHVATLERMAKRWDIAVGTSKNVWEVSAASNIEHFPGLQAIAWIDSSFRVQWVVPQNDRLQNLNLRQDPRFQSTLNEARNLRQPRLTPIFPFADGGKGFLVIVPLFVEAQADKIGDRFDGFILGVLSPQPLFDSTLLPSYQYRVQIYDETGLIYQHGEILPSSPSKTVTLRVYGQGLQIQVALASLIHEHEYESPLAATVLGGGLVGAWTLALVVHLGQQANRQSRRTRIINQQLQNELIHRQQAEESLKFSQSRYEALIINIPGMVYRYYPHTNARSHHFTFVSPHSYELLELAPEVMIQDANAFVNLIHVEDLPSFVSSVAYAVEHFLPWHWEGRIVVPSGQMKWIEGKSQAQQTIEGAAWDGILIDISDRKEAEETLRQSEENFRQLTENIRAVFWMSDLSIGQVLYVSPAYEEIWGQPCEALYQDFSQWIDAIHPEDRDRVEQAQINDVFQGTYNEEYRIIRPDGSIRWIHDRSFIIKNQPLMTKRIAGIAEDITARKRVEAALEKELLRSRTLFNTSIDGIVILNHQGDVIQTSSGFARMLGYTVEDTLQLNVVDWDIQWTREELQQILERSIELPPVFETRHQRKDGSLYDVEISYNRAELDGEMTHFCICRDVSDRKQAEMTKQALIEAIPDFLVRLRRDGINLEVLNRGSLQGILPNGEDIVGRSISDTMPVDIANERLALVQQALKSSLVQTQEYQFEFNGEVVYEEARIVPLTIDEVLVVVRDITKRHRAEQALRDSEEKFRQLIDNIHQAFFILSAQGDMVYISPAYEQIWQRSCDSLYADSRSWLDSVHVDDLPRVAVAFHNQISCGQPFDEVYRVIRQNGEIRWISAKSFPLKDESGQVIRFTGIAEDITQQKQAEDALRQSEATKQAIIQAIPDLLIQMHPNGDYIEFVSNRNFNIINSAQVRQDVNIYNVLPYDLAQLRIHYTQLALESNTVQIYEHEIVIEGQQRYEEVRIVPLQHNEVLVMVRDITDRKRAEIDLQNSQARFAGILEIASDAIISVNIKQQITLFNKGAERIFGYTAAEVLGQPLALLMPDRFAQAHQHHINQYAQDGSQTRQMAQRGAIFGRRKDGTEFPAEASIAKLNLNGEIIFTTFLRDISERVQYESERQRAELFLRQSEEKFRMAIDFTYNWEYWQAPDGSFVYVSPSCERITGYTPAEFIENPHLIQTIIHPDDSSTFAHHICDSESKTGAVEFRIITRSQEVRWIAHICQPVFSNTGTYLGKRASNRDISERIRLEAERQQSEQSLRESEARFQAFMRYSPAPAWISDSEGKIAYLSQAYLDTFRVPDGDVIGQSIFDLFPADVAQPLLENIQTVAHTQQVLEAIEVAPRRDGTMGTFLVYKFPMPNLFGQLLVGGVAIDITQQHQAEAALRKSEATKQAIIQAIPDLLMRMYSDGSHVEFISNSPFNLINPTQFIEEINIYNVLPGALAQLRMHYTQQALQTEIVQVYEQEILVEGTQHYEEVRIVPLQHDEVLVMVREITDRKQAEIALQESATREQAIAQIIQQMRQSLSLEAIFATTTQELRRVLNCDRVLVYRFNPDWSGAVVAESIGKGWISVIETLMNEDASFAAQTLESDRCIIKRWDSQEAETQDTYIQKTQGNIYYQETSYRVVKDIYQSGFENCYVEFLEKFQTRAYLTVPIFSNNKLWGLLASYQNSEPREWREGEVQVASQIGTQLGIAIQQAELFAQVQQQSQQLRQAMEAAEAANLAKSMFLANMSHELRTPLNVILGFAQVMSHDSSLTPAQRDDLQTIQRSGDHLLSLINDVLDLSKIETGHCILEESGFDLISLLHTLRTMMAERAKAKQLQLSFDIAPEVPQFVIGDEQKLRQILLNLLSNAIKFTKQGSVTLRVTSWESFQKACLVPNVSQYDSLNPPIASIACTLQFEVADTGIGIAETEQESIFDAFAQAEAGRKSIGGTGLGLTISRRLLALMNGTISVESIPEVGSTFTVTVPVCPASGVDGQVEQQERTIIGLVPEQPHRRILVVDDQRENRSLMVRLLTRLGLEVQEATNGQEAIALWQEWKPDLTWMDIRMPGLDGYEATKQIRAMEHEKASIIIALTAQASQSDRALALAAGCNDYISKPFREETLFLKLKEYLGLEYLYAEASDLPNSPSVAVPDADVNQLSFFDPKLLTQLPVNWLETLEDLALCGNDRAIVDLTNQLAPALDALKAQLLDLANRCEFEQIIRLIHRNFSS
ncbi:PAS domain S-box protein [Leptolyngbya ohadii]|uniref:PAS domain S-box protein n=1 Tax=Leptolyngbya ohadii TaxID=1962290 RepID=UPI000B59F461|nr:PAS domain S-box protein [Leptolyngbya ohadii]